MGRQAGSAGGERRSGSGSTSSEIKSATTPAGHIGPHKRNCPGPLKSNAIRTIVATQSGRVAEPCAGPGEIVPSASVFLSAKGKSKGNQNETADSRGRR